LVGHHRRANRGVVINILRHHLDDLRKPNQSYKRGVESLLLGGGGQLGNGEILVLGQPIIDVQNFLGIGGRCRDLG
jgi:hypothetical protein